MAEQRLGLIAKETSPAGRAGSIPLWVRVVVVLGAILTAMGAVIALANPAMLVSPHDEINGAVRVFAGYLFARNLAIALLLVALLLMGAQRALGNLLALVGLIQVLDAVMDAVEGRWPVFAGVLVLGIVFLIASAKLCDGYAFWRREAWKG